MAAGGRWIPLEFSGPLRQVPEAPLLFGHLAWAVALSAGKSALDRFLEPFIAGEPPFLISSVFPARYLPRPLLPPAQDPRLRESQLRKEFKKLRWLSIDQFKSVAREGEGSLLESVAQEIAARTSAQTAKKPEFRISAEDRVRVGISRVTGGAYPGILFEESYLRLEGKFGFYLSAQPSYDLDFLLHNLELTGLMGIGGKTSIGLGGFSVGKPEEVTLPATQAANAETSLAPFLLPENPDGFYRLEPYWGRLGHHYAHSANPFKRAYLRAATGSTLLGQARGGMLEVTPTPPPEPGLQIFEYGYAFPLGVRV